MVSLQGAGQRHVGDLAIVIAAVLAIGAFALLLLVRSSSNYLIGDASQYLSVAEQLLAGEGLTSTTLVYPSQLDQGMPAKQTIWPPGLSVVTAALAAAFSIDPALALVAASLAAHVVTALIILWTALSYHHRPVIAAALAVSYGIYWVSWGQALEGMAEPLFIATLVGAAACLAGLGGARPYWRLACGALLIAAAFLVRYQAAPFVIAFALAVYAQRLRVVGWLRALIETALAMAPAAIAIVAITASNLNTVGSLRGAPDQASGNTILEIAYLTLAAIHELLGGEAGVVALAASMVSIVALLAIAFIVRDRINLAVIKGKEALLAFALLGTIANAALIIIRAAGVHFLEARLLLPSIPLLIIAAVALLPAAPKEVTTPGRSRTVAGLAALSAATFALAAALNAQHQLRWMATTASPVRIEAMLQTPYQGAPLKAFLSEAASLSSPILSNRSQHLYVVLRRPTIGVPIGWMAPEPWTPEDIHALAERFSAEYLVVFFGIGPSWDDDFVLQMLEQDPAFLTPIIVTEKVALYRIDER